MSDEYTDMAIAIINKHYLAPSRDKLTKTIADALHKVAQQHTEALTTLIKQWEKIAKWEERSNSQYARGLDQCANDLRKLIGPT